MTIRHFYGLCLIILASLYGCNQTDIAISNPVPDCYDGIQNQGEKGVDCGGPCIPCPAKVTAKVDGVPWASEGNVSAQTNNNSIIILSSNGTSSISLIYSGPFITGTYNLQSGLYTIISSNTNYISSQGSITFTQWDTQEGLLNGVFDFVAFESSGSGDTVIVAEGTFESVSYQP